MPKALRTDWRSRWPDYLATVGVLVMFAAIIVFAVWRSSHRTRPEPKAAPVGFTAEWKCTGAGTKGGGFCWRDLPPARPRQP